MPKLDAPRALALLRIAVGLLVFWHGVTKVLKGPVAAIGRQVAAHGFPESFAYVVTAGELAGLFLAVGLYSRLAAAFVAVTMLGIAGFVQVGLLASVGTGKGVPLEYPLLLAVCCLVLAIGPGTRWTLDALRRRR